MSILFLSFFDTFFRKRVLFANFTLVKDDFLHRIDVNRLKIELGMSSSEIASLAGISENGVYKWSWTKDRHGTRPSYNALVSLLEKGASVETLFGVDYKSRHQNENGPIKITDEDLSRALFRAAEILGKNDK